MEELKSLPFAAAVSGGAGGGHFDASLNQQRTNLPGRNVGTARGDCNAASVGCGFAGGEELVEERG